MKKALNFGPETKAITFPMWRDEREHLVCLDYLMGAFAMWAVRQSPYEYPDDLDEAIHELRLLLQPKWKNDMFIGLSCDNIEKLLTEVFEKSSWVMKWNEPKSGHNAPFVACSRYDKPKPDDDIIGLCALAKNISHTIILEALYNEEVKQ